MAQTDARTGFRLPWSSDRQSTDPAATDTAEATAWPTEDSAGAAQPPAVDPWTGAPIDGAASPDAIDTADAPEAAAPEAAPPPAPAPKASAKKPSKFLADLTKAMQSAAEEARARALTQLQTDAKAHIETIHGRSSSEAASLRRKADDDVAAVREWSKAEIARIREETETKITERKGRLEREIEESAAVIEREIDAVQKTVNDFEAEMATFFERLLAEDDPTRFATMAENLPEPPSFESIVAAAAAAAPVETAKPDETEAVAETVADDTAVEGETAEVVAKPESETTDELATAEAETTADGDATDKSATAAFASVEGLDREGGEFDGEVDREAAFAAIQAAAEAAASAEVAADAAARAEAVADVAIEIIGHETEGDDDSRYASLGLSPDFDAAEAESFRDADGSTEEVPEVGEEALSARLAGLGKTKGSDEGATATQVVVVGLVSVASIASFKRHLGRLAGVNSVGVSSGPDGEFVFAVNHSADVALRDLIPSLPSFQARVTSASDGTVNVTARDPETDA